MFHHLFQPNIFRRNQYRLLKTAVTKWQTTSEKPSSAKNNEICVETEEAPYPSIRTVPVVQRNECSIALPFDEVPGPKALKYMSGVRHYLSEVGTQITAGTLTFWLNIGSILKSRRPHALSSSLFDEYGPVVRFISPLGGDIVLINNPAHIEKVFSMEGKYPVRSTLDSLDKYRKEHRSNVYRGAFFSQGEEWSRQRTVVEAPLNNSLFVHTQNIYDISEAFTQKIYNLRNHQDVVPNDLYKQLNKWAFDCLGLVLFSKKFNMIADTEAVFNRCDMSWLHESLESATKAILKCESGMHMWKLFPTPAWYSLVKHCDNVDNIIGKHVLEIEQYVSNKNIPGEKCEANETKAIEAEDLICAMLRDGFSAEDVTTIVMDMMIIGVESVSSSISFLLYHLAKYQKCQKALYEEIENIQNDPMPDVECLRAATPYLQACIKESLRLVPPIPLLTRVLPRNITLDKYNIPRGTMIIISTRDASLKEANYEDACKFNPERWLNQTPNEYPVFASIPFGFGARKCVGQNLTETMLTVLTMKILKKYHLEYHYGDIQPTKTFIIKPNKPLKIRFTDRY